MKTLVRDALICDLPVPKDPTKGLDAVADRLIGRHRRRASLLRGFAARVERVVADEDKWRDLSTPALAARLAGLRKEFRRAGAERGALIEESLGALREAADRKLGLRPFPVQLIGALALHHNCLLEMATGEGKTLTAGLAAVLAGWTGRPCHVVTVNDYLAERDARWMDQLFQFCGVSAGHVTGPMEPAARAAGYAHDVTYTTSKEIVADFLRDRLRLGRWSDSTRWRIHHRFRLGATFPDGVVMRGLHTAIVDEADSVLIDEAVTPLIISGVGDEAAVRAAYGQVWELIGGLRETDDFVVNPRYREVELTPSGRKKVMTGAGPAGDEWRSPFRLEEMAEQALTARELYHRGKHYVVREGKVVIVDEFTGRMMQNRKWRNGLHQAVEAKEGVPVSAVDVTLARLSFQRFFRLFRNLSGMTGTAWEVAGEFWHIYRLPVVRVPSNRPCIRVQLPDRFFAKAEDKWRAIVEEIAATHASGRPVLVGTRSVAASEELAARLGAARLPHELLNALQDREEARIIAGAGEAGRITIATNMAGRGTDIRLGAKIAGAGGLHVIATERHESKRVDRQLFGRAARQGDPGSARAYVSAEDELLTRFGSPLGKRLLGAAGRGWLPPAAVSARVIAGAQHEAERQARLARTGVLRMDTWIDDAVAFSGRGVT